MQDGADGRNPGRRMTARNEHVDRLVLPAPQARQRQPRTSGEGRAWTRCQHHCPFALLLGERTVVQNDGDGADRGPAPRPDLGLHRVPINAALSQLTAAQNLVLPGREVVKSGIHAASLPRLRQPGFRHPQPARRQCQRDLCDAVTVAPAVGRPPDSGASASGTYVTPSRWRRAKDGVGGPGQRRVREAIACRANKYESTPRPVMVPVTTADSTEW